MWWLVGEGSVLPALKHISGTSGLVRLPWRGKEVRLVSFTIKTSLFCWNSQRKEGNTVNGLNQCRFLVSLYNSWDEWKEDGIKKHSFLCNYGPQLSLVVLIVSYTNKFVTPELPLLKLLTTSITLPLTCSYTYYMCYVLLLECVAVPLCRDRRVNR